MNEWPLGIWVGIAYLTIFFLYMVRNILVQDHVSEKELHKYDGWLLLIGFMAVGTIFSGA